MFQRKEFNFEAEVAQIDINVGQKKFEDALQKIQALIARKDLKQDEKNLLLDKVGSVLTNRQVEQHAITPGHCYE